MQETKDWIRTTKKITGTEEILEVDFSSRSYIFTEKKLLISSFGEARHKEQNIIYFIILNGLL